MAKKKTNLQKAVEAQNKGEAKVPVPETPAFAAKEPPKATGKRPLPADVPAWLRECRPETVPDQPAPKTYTAHLVPDRSDVYGVPPTWDGPEDAPCYIGAPFARVDEDVRQIGLTVWLGDKSATPDEKRKGAVPLPLVKVAEAREFKCGVYVRGDVYEVGS